MKRARWASTTSQQGSDLLDSGENPVGITGISAGPRLPDHRRLSLTLLPGIVRLFVLVGVCGRRVHGEAGAWDSILFRCPGSQIRQLAPFRAEWPPRVLFPGCRLATHGAGHRLSIASLGGRKKSLCCERGRTSSEERTVAWRRGGIGAIGFCLGRSGSRIPLRTRHDSPTGWRRNGR